MTGPISPWAARRSRSSDLTAGEHTIRMTNLGDGLALDWLALIREK